MHIINQKSEKETVKQFEEFNKLTQKNFNDAESAEQALEKFKGKLNYMYLCDAEVIKEDVIKDGNKKSGKIRYKISGNLACNIEVREKQLERKGCFIVATNELDCNCLTDEKLLSLYKDQQKVERGFRFLKDPMFMASTIFLKSVKRITSLMMIMTLCLAVYAALERKIREVLKKQKKFFPDQKGKPTVNPTARWVFKYFSGIHFLIVAQMQILILNLNACHIQLLNLLGENYVKIYSNSE